MRTSTKLWLGFGTLTALLLLSSAIIFARVRSIESQLVALDAARSPAAATRALWQETAAYALHVQSSILTAERPDTPRATAAAETMARQFDLLLKSTSDENNRTRVAGIQSRWLALHEMGESLRKSEGDAAPAARQQFSADADAILADLNSHLHGVAIFNYNALLESTIAHAHAIAVQTWILLAVGVAGGVAVSIAAGRSVLQREKTLTARVADSTHALQRANEFLNALLDNVQVGIVACDTNGTLTLFNKTTRQFHGIPYEALPASEWAKHYNIYHMNGAPMKTEDVPLFRALQGERVENVEMVIRPHAGPTRFLNASGQAIRDSHGQIIGAVVSMVDVTVQRQARETLQHAHDVLEASVKERTSALVLANESLKKEMDVRARAEAALRESESLNRNVIESSPDCVKLLDAEGRLLRMNQNGLRLFELNSIESIVGKPYDALWPEPLRRLVQDAIATARATGLGRFQGKCPTAKGTLRWWDVVIAPIQTVENQPVQFVAVSREISDLKHAESALSESEERFRMLADNISQFAWTADAEGSIYWYNQRWYDYTGTTLEQMHGWGWKSVHHPDHIDRVIAGWKPALAAGVPWEDTFPLRGKDGRFRWFLSRAQPIRDESGGVVRWFGTNTDINAQRELETELRQLADDLAESDRRKNEFLAMLAHELRNPLAPMRNAIEIIKRADGDPSRLAGARGTLERQIAQMVHLIDDLLDVSRISRNKLELRRELRDLASIIHHAVEIARPEIDASGHSLTVKLPPQPLVVNGDPVRLAQVFSNLLNNAAKYTPPGGRVAITLLQRDAQALVTVSDNGIGIRHEMLDRIFELFTQVDQSIDRAKGGLGIGLTLVQRLVDMHGGSVTARSEGVGRGSDFTVTLPLAVDAPAALPPAAAPQPETPTPRTVLVVDDNIDAAESLSLLLQMHGHTTEMCHDGAEAIDKANAFKPDVILLDLGLPTIDGCSARPAIREHDWARGCTIIALTGWGQEDDRRKTAEAGFDGHLVKPVDIDTLLALLAKLAEQPAR